MRNGSFWSDVAFEKEVSFHKFDFYASDLEFEVTKSTIWTHTTLCDQGHRFSFFLLLLSRNFDDKSSSNFHRSVIFCIIGWDIPSDWRLVFDNEPIVSTVFKLVLLTDLGPFLFFGQFLKMGLFEPGFFVKKTARG